MIKKLLISLCLLPFFVQAQNGIEEFTFGLQYKPIISASYFNAGDESAIWEDGYSSELLPRFGQSLGMVVRYNFSTTFSLETGLNLVNRRYRFTLKNSSINLDDYTTFTLRSYEFPIQLLSYVRIAEQYYINASFGNSFNVFPSDIISFGEKNDLYFLSTSRRKKMQAAFIANLGVEYRTKEKGIFYFGASFHRPWKNTARSFPEYDDGTNSFNTEAPSAEDSKYLDISGNYFTLDIRYFFSSK
ncbi:PorT family protein [Flavobacteriales bacterium]|nr:PorT family protein [Flavobacteriales bacterium]